MAHHTELSLPVGHALFASDYVTGQVFLLDVTDPLEVGNHNRPGVSVPKRYEGGVLAARSRVMERFRDHQSLRAPRKIH
jgi:hypothetical protein